MSDLPIFLVALRDSFQGFGSDDIKTADGPIGTLPAIGTEAQARSAIKELSRVSGVPVTLFRIFRYELAGVMEG